MKNSHESELLNSLIGKKVEIIFFDKVIQRGILNKSNCINGYVIIGEKSNLHFYKTQITEIKEII